MVPRRKYRTGYKKKRSRVAIELRRHRSQFVRRALVRHDWHLVNTARALRLERSQLYHIIFHDPALKLAWQTARARIRARQHRKAEAQWERRQRTTRSPRSTRTKS